MKKVVLILMLVIAAVLFAGCTEALVDSEMTITSPNGAGIKTINVRVHKNDTGFFPKGYKPVVEYLQSQMPEDYIVTFKEDGDYRVFSLTYTFTDINDYNEKTRSMIRDDRYQFEKLKPATLTSKKVDGGYELTFTESTALLHASIIEYVSKLQFQDDIFDLTEGGKESRQAGSMLEFDSVTVKIGDSSRSVKVVSPSNVEKGLAVAPDITVNGVINDGTSTVPKLPDPTVWPSPSPWPSPAPTPNLWRKMEVDKKDYTFVVVPDTQNYTSWYPEIMESMFDYIANNAEKENIKLVMHLGDITNHASALEWHRASNCIRKLDGIVPYALAVGNHDSKKRDASLFNQYFPVSDFKNRPYFVDTLEEGFMENAYYTVKAGIHDYLILALEYGPRDEVVEWANEVVSKYPNHRVILITHAYMYNDGKRMGEDKAYGDIVAYNYRTDPNTTVNDGEDLWDKLVAQHKNMFMVLSGHVEKNDIQSYRIDEGIHGNKVIQMLIDPQTFMRGGDGLMLFLRFSEDGNEIGFEYYSPWRDQHYGEENQFTINYLTVATDEPYRPLPSPRPSATPSPEPTEEPTSTPEPTEGPTEEPTAGPTAEPTDEPAPSLTPGETPTDNDPDGKDPDKSPGTGDKGILVFLILAAVMSGVMSIYLYNKKAKSMY